jgi:hypothetical protein
VSIKENVRGEKKEKIDANFMPRTSLIDLKKLAIIV